MKVGEIIVKPPSDSSSSWVAIAGVPRDWPGEYVDEHHDESPVIRGAGADAALAIKDLWKNIGRAYLGAEAAGAREAPEAPRAVVTRDDVWRAVFEYSHRIDTDDESGAKEVMDAVLDRLGLT
jgi:hypothetical protein